MRRVVEVRSGDMSINSTMMRTDDNGVMKRVGLFQIDKITLVYCVTLNTTRESGINYYLTIVINERERDKYEMKIW